MTGAGGLERVAAGLVMGSAIPPTEGAALRLGVVGAAGRVLGVVLGVEAAN